MLPHSENRHPGKEMELQAATASSIREDPDSPLLLFYL
jgi:hypothetical protein